MQTFLPVPSFRQSAAILDYRRLGQQRREVVQILRAIHGETKGYANHPATKMWSKNVNALVRYGEAICREWVSRGYQDKQLGVILSYFDSDKSVDMPDWFGNNDFHAAHRSNLLRKKPEYYSNFNWSEPNDLPYHWSLPSPL